MSRRRNNIWLVTLVAASVALSYKVYDSYFKNLQQDPTESKDKKYTISKRYSNKSIALTLSSSVLNSKLPLDEILVNSENIVFILPPNISEEDLNHDLNCDLLTRRDSNYKLLKCSNIQGYLAMLQNLKPDMLLICADDLGLPVVKLSQDLSRFIKQIVNIDQTDADVTSKVSQLFD